MLLYILALNVLYGYLIFPFHLFSISESMNIQMLKLEIGE